MRGCRAAGLSAADELRAAGYKVTVYDRHDRAGGLLIYGIPNFKLEKEIVERRVKRLADGGVTFVLNTDIGRDISFAELRARHDAILVATGVFQRNVKKRYADMELLIREFNENCCNPPGRCII